VVHYRRLGIIFCIQRRDTELISSVRQEEGEDGMKGRGEVKGHGESDKEEVQESRDTGEKIEHPWGSVNQLVYSLLRTDLGDFQGLGEFICCSEPTLAISKHWCRVYFTKTNQMEEVVATLVRLCFRLPVQLEYRNYVSLATTLQSAYKAHSHKGP
jgi:hypothetical protein